MTVHLGVGLPGPFFIAFPVLPLVGGIFGLILIPAYLMFYLLLGGLWLMGLMAYAIVWCLAKLVGQGFKFAIAARDDRREAEDAAARGEVHIVNPRLTAADQAFLDEIMGR